MKFPRLFFLALLALPALVQVAVDEPVGVRLEGDELAVGRDRGQEAGVGNARAGRIDAQTARVIRRSRSRSERDGLRIDLHSLLSELHEIVGGRERNLGGD